MTPRWIEIGGVAGAGSQYGEERRGGGRRRAGHGGQQPTAAARRRATFIDRGGAAAIGETRAQCGEPGVLAAQRRGRRAQQRRVDGAQRRDAARAHRARSHVRLHVARALDGELAVEQRRQIFLERCAARIDVAHPRPPSNASPSFSESAQRARCTSAFTDFSVISSVSAISAYESPSTAESQSAARWRSGSAASAVSTDAPTRRACATSSARGVLAGEHERRPLGFVLVGAAVRVLAARAAQLVEREVRRDRVEPGREARVGLVALARAVHAQERLLHQLLRGGGVAHHALDVAEQGARPAAEERVEGRLVPRTQGEHQPDVVVAVVHPSPPPG